MRKHLLCAVLFCLSTISFHTEAQEAKILKIQTKPEGVVIIDYELLDDKPEQKYSMHLYASTDNYIQPLSEVTGDIGIDLPIGSEKRIVWDAKTELGSDFLGDVSLELKGQVYIPFIELSGFSEGRMFKRGNSYDLSWNGGRGDNILNFDLYQDQDLKHGFDERPNVGNTTIIIPKDVKPGRYKFKISDRRNKDEVVYSVEFYVKRKVPLGIKLGVGLVVAGAVGYLISNSGSGSSAESKIVDPPLPTQ